MASGSFIGYVRKDKEYVKVWWSSTPIEGENASNLSIYARMYRPTTIDSWTPKTVGLFIGDGNSGSSNSSGGGWTFTHRGWGGSGWTDKFAQKTVKIKHDANGQATVNITLDLEIDIKFATGRVGNITVPGTAKLDNLTTKSTFTLSTNSATINDSIGIALKRNSSNARHDITYKIGEKSSIVLGKDSDDGNTERYSFALNKDVLSSMTGPTSTVTVSCATYSSASSTTPIGTYSKTFELKIENEHKPTISSITAVPAPVTGNHIDSCYIAKKTAAKLNIDATDVLGKTITKYIVTVGDESKVYNQKSPITTIILPNSGTNNIKVIAIDSREVQSEVKTIDIDVVSYSAPTITNLSAIRCNSDGSSNENGETIKITGNLKYSKCNEDNLVSVKIYSKLSTADDSEYEMIYEKSDLAITAFDQIIAGTYAVSSSYKFKIEITDNLSETRTLYTDITTETVLLDIAPTGVGIGKISERENALEVKWDIYCDGGIYTSDGSSLENHTHNILTNSYNGNNVDVKWVADSFDDNGDGTTDRTSYFFRPERSDGEASNQYGLGGVTNYWDFAYIKNLHGDENGINLNKPYLDNQCYLRAIDSDYGADGKKIPLIGVNTNNNIVIGDWDTDKKDSRKVTLYGNVNFNDVEGTRSNLNAASLGENLFTGPQVLKNAVYLRGLSNNGISTRLIGINDKNNVLIGGDAYTNSMYFYGKDFTFGCSDSNYYTLYPQYITDLVDGKDKEISVMKFEGGILLPYAIRFTQNSPVGTSRYPSGSHIVANGNGYKFLNKEVGKDPDVVRGIGMNSDKDILIGQDEKTGSMYFYISKNESMAFYAGTKHSQILGSGVFADNNATNAGKRYLKSEPVYSCTTTSGSAVKVASSGILYRDAGSSIRFKKDITTELDYELDPNNLYDVDIYQYKYKDGHISKDDSRYNQNIIGLIAENLEEHYPVAVNYDEDGQVADWSEKYMIPPMLKLIQDQKKEIDKLKETVAELQSKLN